MRIVVSALAILVATACPLRAQPLDEVMEAIRNGGGWVAVAIEDGRGSVSTLPLPTMGLTLTGCMRIWDGHSGRWRIRALDTIGLDSLEVSSLPGQGVHFSHTFGLRTQLQVDFAWSEPRDTTLFMWVGLGAPDGDRDPCVPVD